jgi:hypothetical protein
MLGVPVLELFCHGARDGSDREPARGDRSIIARPCGLTASTSARASCSSLCAGLPP